MNRCTQAILRCLGGLVVIGALTFAVPVIAEEAPPQLSVATTQPATRPTGPDLPALTRQLGAERFKDREAATEELRKLGKDALPALKSAAASTDPEVQARAQGLIKELEDKDRKPAEASTAAPNGPMNGPMQVRINGRNIRIMQGALAGNNGAVTFHISSTVTIQGNASRNAIVSINGNTYKLRTDASGLKMSATENGQTREYAAKDAEDLKKNDPEAYRIYDRVFGGASGPGGIQITPAP